MAADVTGLATCAAGMTASAAGVSARAPCVAKACATTGAPTPGVSHNSCAAQENDRTGANPGKVPHDLDALS